MCYDVTIACIIKYNADLYVSYKMRQADVGCAAAGIGQWIFMPDGENFRALLVCQ